MPESGDETLVVASRRGDRAAFEELVRRTGRLLFARIYLETADAHRTEDLVQETFLLAWRRIGTLNEPKHFRTWLTTIAHGVVIDAVRRSGRKKRGSMRTGSDESESLDRLPDSHASPADSVERDEEKRRVLSVLRSLPDEYRQPLTLRYLAGADYETIGRQLAISNGSLRGLLQRGLKRLREELNK